MSKQALKCLYHAQSILPDSCYHQDDNNRNILSHLSSYIALSTFQRVCVIFSFSSKNPKSLLEASKHSRNRIINYTTAISNVYLKYTVFQTL